MNRNKLVLGLLLLVSGHATAQANSAVFEIGAFHLFAYIDGSPSFTVDLAESAAWNNIGPFVLVVEIDQKIIYSGPRPTIEVTAETKNYPIMRQVGEVANDGRSSVGFWFSHGSCSPIKFIAVMKYQNEKLEKIKEVQFDCGE